MTDKQPDEWPIFALRLGLGFAENPSCVALDIMTDDGMARFNRTDAIKIIEDAIAAPTKRELGCAAGALLKSTDSDFPGWLVAVPLGQMKDIKDRFKKLIALGQTHYKAFDTQSADITALKGSVFEVAEMGCLHAGNWTQQEPPTDTEENARRG